MNIEAIEEKTAKLMELVKEYKQAKEAESKDYRLIPDKVLAPQYLRYYLIDIKTGETKCYGPADRIKSYCRLRNITEDQILKG